jgi:hypothetical protein
MVRKLKVAAAVAMTQVPETSRPTFLAMAEIMRRSENGGTCNEHRVLTPFELRVFSQNGEDGVIAEILHRLGAPSRYFVEFGATSSEANCTLLADVFGWHGLFIDASDKQFERLQRKYGAIAGVKTRKARITPENIEALFADAGVPPEPDVLSIDIDGQDYYVWEAIEAYRPRLVVIEYNAGLDPARRLVQPRGDGGWDGTAFYGASIGALESLATLKDYRLVHTELTGNNAFFVRADLRGEFPEHADVPRRASNYRLRGFAHDPDPAARSFVDLDLRP